MRPNEIVHRFLASIGRPDAAAEYLKFFQAERKERFALVIVSANALRESSDALLADLLFLRKLDLTPVLSVEDESMRGQLLDLLLGKIDARGCDAANAPAVAAKGAIAILCNSTLSALSDAVASLQPRKVVYLITQSGLQPIGEATRSLINLRTDYDQLTKPNVLPTAQSILLGQVQQLFHDSKHTFTVSLTSVHDLLRELFTVKGAGTLVRRGTAVQHFHDYDSIAIDRFAALLHSAFGRDLTLPSLDRPIIGIYLAHDYRGAAVLEERPLAPYLSKFAVDLRAQGEGIGGDLWRALTADHKRFFWRSRPKNPIAPWYASNCDGLVRTGDWTVFWRGIQTNEIPAAVELAIDAPVDFEAQI